MLLINNAALAATDVVMVTLLTVLIGYLCGCFNGAVIVSKYILRNDIRTHGSGNAGLTNFFRVFGGPLTFAVILTDMLKAVAAVLIGSLLFSGVGDPTLGKFVAGIAALLGHMFPCMFEFKGGKGILSGGTIAIMIDWRVALVVWGGFLILVALTRFVSLGSIYAAAAFPFATWFILHNVTYTILGAVCAGLILWKHRTNLVRLIQGKESKLTFHKKTDTEAKP